MESSTAGEREMDDDGVDSNNSSSGDDSYVGRPARRWERQERRSQI